MIRDLPEHLAKRVLNDIVNKILTGHFIDKTIFRHIAQRMLIDILSPWLGKNVELVKESFK